MSGIYLIVWDEVNKDKSPVLRTTKGGYPHMTVAYTGKELSRDELVKTAQLIFAQWALTKVTLLNAKVNSFEDRPGHTRHDVLIMVNADLESVRHDRLRLVYPNWEKFHMGDPHVTHGIYESESEALDVANALNDTYLPMEVVVTGVTID